MVSGWERAEEGVVVEPSDKGGLMRGAAATR